jgi:preprotein translocase subunit SecF
VLIYIFLRWSIPSLAVIIAVFSDILITLAIVNLLGIKLSSAGIAAFLMLIGYSVDTNILLSIRLLKRKEGTGMERIYGALKTGLTMTTTTVIAVTVTMLITQSEIIKQIMLILLIGLVADLISTWIQNVGILRFYLERKAKKRESEIQS